MHEIFVYCQSMIVLMSTIVTSVTTLQILEQIYISLIPSPSLQPCSQSFTAAIVTCSMNNTNNVVRTASNSNCSEGMGMSLDIHLLCCFIHTYILLSVHVLLLKGLLKRHPVISLPYIIHSCLLLQNTCIENTFSV